MPKITVTFLEEGSDPIKVELPETTGAVLDMYVAETVDYDPGTSEPKPRYSGKAELFLKHIQSSLINPLVERYASAIASDLTDRISEIEAEKKQIEDQIKTLVTPKLV